MPRLPRDARDAADAIQAAGEALDKAKKAWKRYAADLDPRRTTGAQREEAKVLAGDIENLSRSASGLSERIGQIATGR